MIKNAIKRNKMLYAILLKARSIGGRTWMRLCHGICGVQPKKVFFSSFKGKHYSDSPRFISEALHELRPDVQIVWQLANGQDAPSYVRTVRPHTLAALREIATAGCIVDNFNRPIYMLKFSDQRYVQTWHGDRGFKKVLCDLPNPIDYPDGRQMDLAVAGSDFAVGVYRSAFRYEGEALVCGMPRNDILVNAAAKDILDARARIHLRSETNVLTYAPTFRDATAGRVQPAGFDLEKALAALRDATGQDWIALTRAHDMNRAFSEQGQDIIDVTDYPEMSDILLATNLLITDYSSSAGDFALLHRPVILYQPDLADFMQDEREMYFDIRRSPYLRAESQDALMEMLSRYPDLPDRSDAILTFYGAKETGASAKAAAGWISEAIDKIS